MPTVYVLHLPDDESYVQTQLLRPLPALGFTRWVSSGSVLDQSTRVDAMVRSAAIIAVVSRSALDSSTFVDEAALALTSRTTVIPVFLAEPDLDAASATVRKLWRLARIDGPDLTGLALWSQLDELLPPPADLDKTSVPMSWDTEAFSELLAQAAERNDQRQMAALVDAFVRYDSRPAPYPADAASHDLEVLRGDREFLLMRRYATSAVRPGTTDFRVRRQLAQSLIELKEFDSAVEILTALVGDTRHAKDPVGRNERGEALGLLGRCLKQRYVDGDSPPDGGLTEAIGYYQSAFEDNPTSVWYGVNIASCTLRAHRDGATAPPIEYARSVAETIKRQLREQAEGGPLAVWECASKVEVHSDLGEFDQAAAALDDLLAHPELTAFAVSSLYRQLDEVLQLADDSAARPLLARLANAAGRQRAVRVNVSSSADRSMLVRVTDPNWAPSGIPDLTVHARLGTILSVSGSDQTVRALLKDPQVTNVEESRPAGSAECDRSIPFVHATGTYTGIDGSQYHEDGSEALIAVIDDDIDVLHQAFRDADGRPRIIGVWDQKDSSGPPPAGFTFGTYHSETQIAEYVETRTPPDPLARIHPGHGTHVASIASGRQAGRFAGGVAPGAQLLVVISSGTEPTGYSQAYVSALTFVDQTAKSLGKPVVVNISQGMNAGAHDGTSAVEAIFDSFTGSGRTPGRVVVKSAGNTREMQGHATLTVPPMSVEDLRIHCDPGRRVDVELWWDSADQYRFRLTAPTGITSPWVDLRNLHAKDYFDNHGNYRVNLVRRHIDNGDSLLSVTFHTGFLPPEGAVWTLAVEAIGVPRSPGIHAWIERNDHAHFLGHGSEEMTLTVPGTARSVITVGAIEAQEPLRVGPFSAYGPTRDRRDKPDVCAPGVKVSAAKSGSDDDVTVMCGTSMAAPHVTGAIALLLSKTVRAKEPVPTASQIGKALRQSTRNPSGRWDRGQGYGVLDVEALLEGF